MNCTFWKKATFTWYNLVLTYSHQSNKRGSWNKRGGGARFAKSLNVEVGINEEGGILWKKLMHNSNKRQILNTCPKLYKFQLKNTFNTSSLDHRFNSI
jgi:hypothetical protein